MDDSNRQNNENIGNTGSGDIPASPPPPPSSPQSGPSQPAPQQPSRNLPPPPPPPPTPQPYGSQQAGGSGQGQQPTYPGQSYPPDMPHAPQPQQPGYGAPVDYSSHNQPTQAYPAQGVPLSRYEQPTEAYPQTPYGQPPGQGYPPQGGYPPQYMPPMQPPVAVNAPKKGVPMWAWLVPLLLVLVVGGALTGWFVLQNQETERKAHAASTATAQSQATATAAQAEINRKATATVAAQKTATAATDAANRRGTATAQSQATATAKAEATASAKAAATSTAVAAMTATAVAIAELSLAQTATAQAIIIPPTATVGGVTTVQGEIQGVTVEQNVSENSLEGMRIHVKFTVDGLKSLRSQATAYFYYDTGEPVKDLDGNFNTVDGQVAVSSPFTPGFDSTLYSDLQLFIPYEQFHLDAGSYKLQFQVQVYVLSPYKLIVSSDYIHFDLTR